MSKLSTLIKILISDEQIKSSYHEMTDLINLRLNKSDLFFLVVGEVLTPVLKVMSTTLTNTTPLLTGNIHILLHY